MPEENQPKSVTINLFMGKASANHSAALAEWAVNQEILRRMRKNNVTLTEAIASFLQEIAKNGESGVFSLESPVPPLLIKIETGSGPLEFGLRISIPEANLARLEMIVQNDISQSLENLIPLILKKILRGLLNELPEEIEIQTSTVKVPDIRQLIHSPSSQR